MATSSHPVGDTPLALSDDASSRDLLARILASLDDDKAEEVVTIDLRGRSDMADYMVVCSGRSSRTLRPGMTTWSQRSAVRLRP